MLTSLISESGWTDLIIKVLNFLPSFIWVLCVVFFFLILYHQVECQRPQTSWQTWLASVSLSETALSPSSVCISWSFELVGSFLSFLLFFFISCSWLIFFFFSFSFLACVHLICQAKHPKSSLFQSRKHYLL